MTAAAESFNKTRAVFMQRASAPNIPPHAFKLAWMIAYRYMNRDTRTARPAQETLARDLNVSVRTVQRLLDILQPLGLAIVLGHGPNRASTYWIEPQKTTPVSPINTTPVSPIERREGDNRRQKRRQPTTEKATPVSPQPIRRTKKKNQAVESDSRAPNFSPGLKNDSRAKNRPEPKAQAELVEAFETFWHTFPKQIGRDAAFAAYTKAVQSGAEPEAINRGAKLYALAESARIEREGTPRYTMHPANWLKAGRYKDPPPHGTVIDPEGNVVAAEPPHEEPKRSGFAGACDELLAEIEAKGGGWF
jgi:hypothetical protein